MDVHFPPLAGRTHVVIPLPGSDGVTLRLPKSGTQLNGHFSHEDYVNYQRAQITGFSLDEYARDQPTHGQLVWTITPASADPDHNRSAPAHPPKAPSPIVDPVPSSPPERTPIDDVDLIVLPENYDTWRPKDGVSENDSANTLSIEARLVSRKGGPLPHRATTITFSLVDVSRFPGTASANAVTANRPSALPAKGPAPDLGFEAKQNPDAQVGAEKRSARFAHGPYVGVTAVLSSFDSRATGSVLVIAQLDDGRILLGKMPTVAGEVIPVPKSK